MDPFEPESKEIKHPVNMWGLVSKGSDSNMAISSHHSTDTM